MTWWQAAITHPAVFAIGIVLGIAIGRRWPKQLIVRLRMEPSDQGRDRDPR